MAKILVAGPVANKLHNGGEGWIRLSWLLGLRRLGCEVFFVEQIDPASCVGESGEPVEFERSANRAYFDSVMAEFGLERSASLILGEGEATSGVAFADVLEVAEDADLLVNYSGHITAHEIMRRVSRKAYLDGDPGFTQFWHAQGNLGARLEGHDLYFTVGENIGSPDCPIPTLGLNWRPLPQPVVLDEWPAGPPGDGPFTTIGAWRGPFGPVVHDGHTYGLKVHEFRKVIELPRRVGEGVFEIALDIHPGDDKDREALLANGWRLADPRTEAAGPQQFRRYVERSGAEFSVAQGIYVETGSGWFSDRTVRYLAAGRPALVQDTGFSRNYPTGEGLVAFTTLDEAVAGAKRIHADREAHGEAARALAEERFDSDRVLSRFLDEALG
jgi:hypothetical protein